MDTQLNVHEIDGRIIELARQRDEALARCVIMAGQLAALKKELEQKKETSPIVIPQSEEQ